VSALDASIVGLGLSEQGRHLGVSTRELRRRAVDAAIVDAGIAREEIDGYISVGGSTEDLRYVGLDPNFSFGVSNGGASPVTAVLAAAGAIATGQASCVMVAFAEAFTSHAARLTPARPRPEGGMDVKSVSYGYPYIFGMVGPASSYALDARRHMSLYGTTSEQLGAVAIVERDYAAVRPGSMGYGQPITLEDHQASRMIVDPLRLLDCSRPTDGGAAVIVTSRDRARQCANPGVDLLGAGYGHGIHGWWTGEMYERMNVGRGGERALGQAGLKVTDIDVAQLYAPFTIAVLMQLEEYGWCGEGESGSFVEAGGTRPGGQIPTNTGGGQLSGFYATGFTPLSEGVFQVRGTAPSSQVPDVETCLVSGEGGNGGIQGSWATVTLVLGKAR
jgi:acetyl-CoA acetyltransferase